MDIELGIQNVARTVTFSTEQSADEVNNVIAEAVEKTCEWSKAWLAGKDIPAVMDEQIHEYLEGWN